MKYERNFYQIKPNEEILNTLRKEIDFVGYYSLPYQSIDSISQYAQTIKHNNIYVVGIGGSSLGTKAIYKFLRTSNTFNKKLFFIDTIDPLRINYLLSLSDIEDSHFIIISKSGNTIETISTLKYIASKTKILQANTTIISGNRTPLHDYAIAKSLKFFEIPSNVGGRFSVFSPVGLVPLSIVGVDISALLEGCKEVHESFFNKKKYYDLIMNKARFLVENKNRFNINIVFSYSSVFQDFNKWFVQLWAESLGKKNINNTRQGLTPISLLGPDDQHSFLQLVMEGVRDKTITIFKIENFMDPTNIPESKEFSSFNLDYLNNQTFNDLINFQADATYESILAQKDIPCDKITISEIDENNIAKLMYRFQLLTSCVGAFLQINTYDQPGVELGKRIFKEKLCND